MNIADKIKDHQKALNVLLMIAECERRLSSYKLSYTAFGLEWYLERIEVNIKIKERLINYYTKKWN